MSGPWTKEEDVQLVDLLFEHKASFVDAAKQHGRSEDQCRQRWRTHLDPDINHGQFSRDEDRALIIAHSLHGNKWAEIAKTFVGRPDAAIKGRWHNTLKRRVKEANDAGQDALTAAGAGRKKAKAWSREEERSLIIAHSTHGNKWAEIAKRFEGRTQLAIEFHWYAVLKHKVNEALKRGLDALAAADPAAKDWLPKEEKKKATEPKEKKETKEKAKGIKTQSTEKRKSGGKSGGKKRKSGDVDVVVAARKKRGEFAAAPAAQETAAATLHGPVTSTPYSPSTGNATAPSPFGATAAGENLFASPKQKGAAGRGILVEVQTTFFSNQ